MSKRLKEYKGEKVLAGMTARLIPPNDNYPDCMCDLLLTKYRLYVLEDNFDGTYTEHFVFSIQRLQKMEIKKSGEEVSGWVRLAASLLLAIISLGGAVYVPIGKKSAGSRLFMIAYINEKGDSDVLYFQDLESTPKVMENVFHKLKEQY